MALEHGLKFDLSVRRKRLAQSYYGLIHCTCDSIVFFN